MWISVVLVCFFSCIVIGYLVLYAYMFGLCNRDAVYRYLAVKKCRDGWKHDNHDNL